MIRKKIGSGHGCHNFKLGGGGAHWKTDIELLKIATNWNVGHSSENNVYSQTQLCDGIRYGMTRSEGNQVQSHVNGTLHRMMWQNCKILCKDVWRFVYGHLKTYLWLVTVRWAKVHIHSLCLGKSKLTQNLNLPRLRRLSTASPVLPYESLPSRFARLQKQHPPHTSTRQQLAHAPQNKHL